MAGKDLGKNLEGMLEEGHVLPKDVVPQNTEIDRADSHRKVDTTQYQYPLIGHEVGGVKVLDKVGQGGMTVVYKGIHVKSGKIAALKVLPPNQINAHAIDRFVAYIKAMEQLNHPNIAKTIDAGFDESSDAYKGPFLVEELLDGYKDLTQIVLDPVTAAMVMLKTANGLDYLHLEIKDGDAVVKKSYVHRDVKPHNIMICAPTKDNPEYVVKLIDLGIVKSEREEGEGPSLTSPGEFIGTPQFMAPEQAEDGKKATTASDVYAWACTAFYTHAREAPLEERTADLKKMLTKRANAQIPLGSWLNESINRKRKLLEEELKNADEQNKIRIADELNKIVPVSDSYEDVIMMILTAKDSKTRPPFSLIIDKVIELIKTDSIVRREMPEEEMAKREAHRKILSANLPTLEDLAKSSTHESEKLNAMLAIANTLEELFDLTSRDDPSRVEVVARAHQAFHEAKTNMRYAMQQGVFKDDATARTQMETRIEYADGRLVWLNYMLALENARKVHRESTQTRNEFRVNVSAVEAALKENKYDVAADAYRKLSSRPVPEDYKTVFGKVTEQLNGVVSKEVEEGTSAAQTDVETATKRYKRAQLLAEVLPEATGAKQRVDKFYSEHIQERQVANQLELFLKEFSVEYTNYAGENDFYSMLLHVEAYVKKLDGLEKELGNNEQIKKVFDDARGVLTKHTESLDDKKRNIKQLELLIADVDQLEKKLDEEAGGGVSSEENIKYLAEDRINHYMGKVKEISDEFATVKSENIGPIHEQFRVRLGFFKDDIDAEVRKHGLNVDKPYGEWNSNLTWLISHYHDRNEARLEDMYLRIRNRRDTTRLAELQPKIEALRPVDEKQQQ